MPDITLCTNTNCPLKDRCYRYTAQPKLLQSYTNFKHDKKTNTCEGFIDNKKYAESKKPIKVIFLDIDGVLNSDEYFRNRKEKEMYSIDKQAVERLNQVLNDNIYIVISSTWRLGYTLGWLKQILETKGLEKDRIIDFTPNLISISRFRGDEIAKWLDMNKDKYEIVDYVILDDDNDFTDEQKKKHFIHIDYLYGLQDKHIKLLKQKLSSDKNEYKTIYCSICNEAHIITTEKRNDIKYTCSMCCEFEPDRCENDYDQDKVIDFLN